MHPKSRLFETFDNPMHPAICRWYRCHQELPRVIAKLLSRLLVLTALAAWIAPGCATRYLPGTEIAETPETKALYDVVMQYKRAMETRQPSKILPLVSRNYYENNGTTDTRDDDYGYERLKDVVRVRTIGHEVQKTYF